MSLGKAFLVLENMRHWYKRFEEIYDDPMIPNITLSKDEIKEIFETVDGALDLLVTVEVGD